MAISAGDIRHRNDVETGNNQKAKGISKGMAADRMKEKQLALRKRNETRQAGEAQRKKSAAIIVT